MHKFYGKAYKTLAKCLFIRENAIEILKISKTLNAHKLKAGFTGSVKPTRIQRLSLNLASNHALVRYFDALFLIFAF